MKFGPDNFGEKRVPQVPAPEIIIKNNPRPPWRPFIPKVCMAKTKSRNKCTAPTVKKENGGREEFCVGHLRKMRNEQAEH